MHLLDIQIDSFSVTKKAAGYYRENKPKML